MHPPTCIRLLLSVLLLVPAVSVAADDDAGLDAADVDQATIEYFQAQRRKAAQEGEWALAQEEQVSIDASVLSRPWRKPPFDAGAFDYSPAQIREHWDTLMANFGVPYFSASSLRGLYARYPELVRRHKGFDGDFQRFEVELNGVWRLFLRGDYQAAMQQGEQLGQMGVMAGKTAQIYYAVYLEPDLQAKHMLLQDAANRIREFSDTFEKMKSSPDPVDRNNYVLARLIYVYAMGRIAEDVPIPVAVARNYAFKILGAVHDVQKLAPDNPLGLAAVAGVDANVVRKVGKATGRITFGARQATIRSGFEQALRRSDLALIRYEYANALLYINRRRDLDEAIAQLRRAASTRPRMAMEALDAMYAHKRLREVQAFAESGVSFRTFERRRARYQRARNENLYCVLPESCPPFIVQ